MRALVWMRVCMFLAALDAPRALSSVVVDTQWEWVRPGGHGPGAAMVQAGMDVSARHLHQVCDHCAVGTRCLFSLQRLPAYALMDKCISYTRTHSTRTNKRPLIQFTEVHHTTPLFGRLFPQGGGTSLLFLSLHAHHSHLRPSSCTFPAPLLGLASCCAWFWLDHHALWTLAVCGHASSPASLARPSPPHVPHRHPSPVVTSSCVSFAPHATGAPPWPPVAHR